jgi:uncharacterized protein YoxC
MDPNNLPTNAEELKAARVAELEEQLAKLNAKAEKLASQAIDAAQHVKDKAAELKACKAAEHVFEEPQEHVRAVIRG